MQVTWNTVSRVHWASRALNLFQPLATLLTAPEFFFFRKVAPHHIRKHYFIHYVVHVCRESVSQDTVRLSCRCSMGQNMWKHKQCFSVWFGTFTAVSRKMVSNSLKTTMQNIPRVSDPLNCLLLLKWLKDADVTSEAATQQTAQLTIHPALAFSPLCSTQLQDSEKTGPVHVFFWHHWLHLYPVSGFNPITVTMVHC